VRVLTGFPNYPVGRIYPGYRQRWKDESTTDGITTRRVPIYPSHDNSAVRRAANYLSFSATSTLAATRFLAGVDAIYVYLTPATTFAAPALLRALHRIPTVIHLQDIWPESVTQSTLAPGGRTNALMYRTLSAAMRWVYRRAAGIAVIAPSMGDLLVERGADPDKIGVVLNWADESFFRPVEVTESARREIGYRGRTTIMHAGNIGAFENIEATIRAAAAQAGEIDLVFVGTGISEQSARDLVTELGANNIRFLGRRPPSEMAPLYAAADYQLVTRRDLPIFQCTIPSKLAAALACSSPVVVSVPGDCSRIVEDAGAGLSCPPDDWQALADQFLKAASLSPEDRTSMAKRARETYESQMSMRIGVDELENMLRTAADNARRSRRKSDG
jgi:glycosyltransferase involved in cell wall biosynthesis